MLSDENQWLEQALCQAERSKCVSRIISIQKDNVVAKGDNYTSDLFRVTLKVLLNSGDIEDRTLIWKMLPSTDYRKQAMVDTGLFVIETRMYTEVLPLMEKIRLEKDSGEPLWGECLAVKGYESLVFEDLANKKYKMGDRMKGLDYDHCVLAMKSLAKFHSLGVVLKQRGGLIVSDYDRYFLERNQTMMAAFYKVAFSTLTDTLESWKGEWISLAERVRKIAVTLVEDIAVSLKFDKGRFLTLNHGDCWINNLLFKYDNDGKPESLRFVDFQATFYNIVGYDLQYFLGTSLTMDLRSRTSELIKIYHEALVDCLDNYNYSGTVPTLEDITEDFNKCSLFGLAISLTLLKLMKMPSSEVPDLEKMCQEFSETKDFKSVIFDNSSEEYEKAIKYIIRDAAEKGII